MKPVSLKQIMDAGLEERDLANTEHAAVNDPSYNWKEIEANPVWHTAFILSEHLNDNAPLGWSRYIPVAETILKKVKVNQEDWP